MSVVPTGFVGRVLGVSTVRLSYSQYPLTREKIEVC